MGKIKWYKRDPDAILCSYQELPLEERGAAHTILDLIYSRGGACPSDSRFLGFYLGCTQTKALALVKILVEKGKFWIDESNGLRTNRSEKEIQSAGEIIEKAKTAGKVGAQKRWGENKQKQHTSYSGPYSKPYEIHHNQQKQTHSYSAPYTGERISNENHRTENRTDAKNRAKNEQKTKNVNVGQMGKSLVNIEQKQSHDDRVPYSEPHVFDDSQPHPESISKKEASSESVDSSAASMPTASVVQGRKEDFLNSREAKQAGAVSKGGITHFDPNGLISGICPPMPHGDLEETEPMNGQVFVPAPPPEQRPKHQPSWVRTADGQFRRA